MSTITIVTTFGITTHRVYNDRAQLLGVFETREDAESYIAELADAEAYRYGTDVMGGMLGPDSGSDDDWDFDVADEYPDTGMREEIEARASDWLKERDNALGIKRTYELDDTIPF